MKRIPVRFLAPPPSQNYTVLVGEGLMRAVSAWVREQGFRNVFFLCDRRVESIAKGYAKAFRSKGCKTETLLIAGGEQSKDYKRIFPAYGKLIGSGMDRKSLLVAVGGGVVGDIAGFLAGTYLRGIRWINLPTTLLAQVDSSVGGKTGVNHPMGKNLIGVFHQPSLVACDIQSLRTLPFRERVCGFGEMIKHGLAFDPGYFRFLSRHQDSILAGDRKHLSEAVANSVQWKARIVAQDPLEKKGKRILLNLGHTVGHALEGATHYEHFRHGEAVIWGMRAAALLSREQGHLRNSAQAEIDLALAKIPVPPVPRLSFRKILSFLRHDKKSSRGKVSFVLLSAIGKTTIDREVPPDSIRKALLELGVKLSP